MRMLVVFVALLAVAMPVRAQDALRDMVEARSVKSIVYVTLENDSLFYYQLDATGGIGKRMPARATIRMMERDGFVLLFGYQNPLQFSWRIGAVEAEDATYASARKFAEAVGTLFTTVGGSLVVLPAAGGDAPGGLPGLALFNTTVLSAATNNVLKGNVYAPGIVEWLMWLPERVACIGSGQPEALVGAFVAVDHALYGTGRLGMDRVPRGSTLFRDSAVAAFNRMKSAASIVELRTSAQSASQVVTLLRGFNEEAGAAVAALEGAITAARIDPASDQCGVFASFTNSQAARVIDDARVVLQQRARTVAALDSVRLHVATVLNTQVNNAAFRLSDVALTEGKTKEITLTVMRQAIDLAGPNVKAEKQAEVKTTLLVREAQTFIVEFASGAIYTEIAYPKYGTAQSEGVTRVARAGDNVQRGAVVGMLNIVPNLRLRGFLYPIAQLGVGSGKEYPLFLAGGGVRFARPFSLSLTGGAAWTWKRELKSLAVGDTVAGTADIENNLEYRFALKPRFYLGVQNAF